MSTFGLTPLPPLVQTSFMNSPSAKCCSSVKFELSVSSVQDEQTRNGQVEGGKKSRVLERLLNGVGDDGREKPEMTSTFARQLPIFLSSHT